MFAIWRLEADWSYWEFKNMDSNNGAWNIHILHVTSSCRHVQHRVQQGCRGSGNPPVHLPWPDLCVPTVHLKNITLGSPIRKTKQYFLKSRIHLNSSNIKSIVMYGTEWRRETNAGAKRTAAFHNECTRGLCGIFSPNKMAALEV